MGFESWRTWWARARAPLAIVAAAMILRLAWQVSTQDSPLYISFQLDPQWHARWAQQIAAGDWTQPEPFFRAPLYPYSLAAAYSATGHRFDGPRVIQHALGALTCGLTFLIARRACGTGAAWAAGLIACFYGPLIYYENELLSTSLEAILIAAVLWSALYASDRPSPLRWWACGFLVGLAAITRPTYLFLWPVVVLWRWAARHAGRSARGLLHDALLISTGVALPILPVTLHNRVCGGEWVLIASQGGVNFYLGNNPESDGKSPQAVSATFPTGEQFVDNIQTSSRRAAEEAEGRRLSDGAVSTYWYGRAAVFWRDQPLAAVRLTLKKGYYLLNGFEIPSLRSMYVDGAFSPVARALVWVHGVAFPAGLVIPLALLGLVLPCERSGATRLIRWALGACALVVVVFFVNSRFRAPLIAIAVVPAGHALAALGRALRTRSAGKLGPWLALLAALILFCNSDYFGVRDVDSAAQASILGSAYQEAGDLHSAAAWFGEAVLARPESVVDRHNLGVALQRLGRAHEAVTQLRRAVELSPGHAVVHNSLGTALEAANRIDESISHYNEAIRLDPDYAPARINLALVHYHSGDFVTAWKNLQLLITNGVPVDPSFVEIVRARLQDESGATSRPGAPTTSRPG